MRRAIWQGWIYRLLRTKSIPVTRTIARRHGERLGFVLVGGYPRSGTTWASQMVGHYLDIPFPDDNALPLSFRCVVHHHWSHEPAFDRSIQVIRDGRDVMVSLYMNLMSVEQAARERTNRFGRLSPAERALLRVGRDAALRRRLERLFGRGFDPWDIDRHLPVFIEAEMTRPMYVVVDRPWPEYVRSWRDRGRRTAFVKYEDLIARSEHALGGALSRYLGEPIATEQLRETLSRYDFRRRAGRRPGDEEQRNVLRKGVAGDWRNHFGPASRQVFDRYAGEALIELGYEPNRDWISERSDQEPSIQA